MHNNGLTLEGLNQFFMDMIRKQGEEAVWRWVDALGYTRNLYSVKSRPFVLSFHSDQNNRITMREAAGTGLNDKVNCMLIEKFGKKKTNGEVSLY